MWRVLERAAPGKKPLEREDKKPLERLGKNPLERPGKKPMERALSGTKALHGMNLVLCPEWYA